MKALLSFGGLSLVLIGCASHPHPHDAPSLPPSPAVHGHAPAPLISGSGEASRPNDPRGGTSKPPKSASKGEHIEDSTQHSRVLDVQPVIGNDSEIRR